MHRRALLLLVMSSSTCVLPLLCTLFTSVLADTTPPQFTFDDFCEDFSWVKTNDSQRFETRFSEFDGISLDDVAEFNVRSLLGSEESEEEDEEEYEDVDCFGLNPKLGKFFRWMFKPQDKEVVDTKFFLITRSHPERLLFANNASLLATVKDVYKPEKQTVFIVHGFMSNCNQFWVNDMADALLSKGDMNVIMVDWGGGSMSWKYWRAVGNTRVVGRELSKLLKLLIKWGTARSNLYLIGHSLGAHICGFAARAVGNVGRITGLDPAQPCFKSGNQTIGLNIKDAMFVDILHTNGKLLSKLGFGLPIPLGLIDFYPNGGQLQPGCTMKESSIWDKFPISKKKLQNAICSHGRSYQFFIDALRTEKCRFWGRQWNLTLDSALHTIKAPCAIESCAPMGLESQNFPAKGSFFVSTRDRTPYCIEDPVTDRRMNLLTRLTDLFRKGFGGGDKSDKSAKLQSHDAVKG